MPAGGAALASIGSGGGRGARVTVAERAFVASRVALPVAALALALPGALSMEEGLRTAANDVMSSRIATMESQSP